MNGLAAVYRRELASYFSTPLAYVFIVIFLLLAGALTFWLGGFYERGQADLAPFFAFHPWLYLFPIWITVNYLGDPDNGAILAGYIGSLAMAGGFLAIGSCLSAATRSQVIAFILTVVVCFVLLLAGYPLVLDAFRGWASPALVDAIASLSLLTHFQSISKGVLDLRDCLYFAMTIGAWLYATTLVLELRRAD